MYRATSPAIDINENAFWSAAIKHQKLLENWQNELTLQTNSFFENVDAFQIFVRQTQAHLQKEQFRLQQEEQALTNVQSCFHQILCRIEFLLEIKNAAIIPTFIDRLFEILRKLQENQTEMEELKEEKITAKTELESFRSRDLKLHSLANKLKELSTELESAISDEPEESCPSKFEYDESESTDCSINNISKLLEEAHEDLESYCLYRRNRDSEIFNRNYLRFKRNNCEALNNFLNLVEKEFFYLWIQEDRAKLSYQSNRRSTMVQTENEDEQMKMTRPGTHFNTRKFKANGNKVQNQDIICKETDFEIYSPPLVSNSKILNPQPLNAPLVTISSYAMPKSEAPCISYANSDYFKLDEQLWDKSPFFPWDDKNHGQLDTEDLPLFVDQKLHVNKCKHDNSFLNQDLKPTDTLLGSGDWEQNN